MKRTLITFFGVLALAALACGGAATLPTEAPSDAPASDGAEAGAGDTTLPTKPAAPADSGGALGSGSADAAGTYVVAGTNQDGSTYSGTLTITSASGTLYNMFWDLGEDISGAGLLTGTGYLVGGFPSANCSTVEYSIAADGTLTGTWVNPNGTTLGTESNTPNGTPLADSLNSSYSVTGTNPDGSPYAGSLTISAEADGIYRLTQVSGPNTFEGVGLVIGSAMGATFGEPGCGINIYQVNNDGTLTGRWAQYGAEGTGTETASRQ